MIRHLIAMTMAALAIAGAGAAHAQGLQADIMRTTPVGPGDPVGRVSVTEGATGAAFRVDLFGLPPGPHGFHVHENATCAPSTVNGQLVPAGAAGGHLDPGHSGHHEGPERAGHLGDLPVLTVAADGTAKQTLEAPRLKDLASLKGHAIMIHVGGDNYADEPLPLGGGGARLACGVLE